MDKLESGEDADQLFKSDQFNVSQFVNKITASSFTVDLYNTRTKLSRAADTTAAEIKKKVYENYPNFMETAKEIGNFEGKMNQLRQSLEEQKKLISLFKNLSSNLNELNPTNFPASPSNDSLNESLKSQISTGSLARQNSSNLKKSSLALILEEVEGCGVVTQKEDRELIFSSELEQLHPSDFSVLNKLNVYLLSDALLLTVPQRKRTKLTPTKTDRARLYKFQSFYELQDINVTNLEDRREVKNAFQILKFPDSLIFRCANAHAKKEWLENIERAKTTLKLKNQSTPKGILENSNPRRKNELSRVLTNYIPEESGDDLNESGNSDSSSNRERVANEQEMMRNKFLREQFSDLDIYLAQRDFEKAVELLLRIKNNSTSNLNMQLDPINELIYKQKESELITMLKKDLNVSKERGNKGIMKTGKRVVNSLVRLKIYDEALTLFIDYHKTLNAEALKRIKLEESNSIYMNNVMNTFLDNLKTSYSSFKEAFKNIQNFSLSTYLTWIDSEIEILIRKLESQHYIGSQFDLTIENCELMFDRAEQFSNSNFEVRYLFEIKLCPIIEKTIKEQKVILISASMQRLKFDDFTQVNFTQNSAAEQNKKTQIQNLIKELEIKNLLNNEDNNVKNKMDLSKVNFNFINSSSIQFARSIVNFFCDLLRIYYQDINYTIIEVVIEIFKGELKKFDKSIKNLKELQQNTSIEQINKSRKSIEFNAKFIFENILPLIEVIYEEKALIRSKNFVKLREKYFKFRADNFSNK